MAAPRRIGHGQAFGASSANNKQAQLTNAYQELAKELESDKLKVIGGYTLGRVIGEGTFGSVHLATHRLTGTRCAIKKIPKASTPQLTREIHHHRRLHHANIVHLYEIIATESHIWLVTELCSGGELFDYLVERGRMLEGEGRRLFGELAVAVGWMHRQGVVHRDLKLENVLLDGELRVKLGDLGFAREWQKGRLMETFCGTTGYASPEMLSGRKYLGEETDIWSLGIILYTLLCGGLPFDDDDERAMKDLILKGEYEEPDWLSEEARALIRGMLQQDPAKRLTIEGVLTHPWFQLTLVDRPVGQGDSHSVPTSPLPTSPLSGEEFFNEPFGNGNATASSSRLTPHLPAPSPLSSNIYRAVESDTSEASVDPDSEHGKTGSGVTTPPTSADDDDDGDKPVHRVNSSEFSATEKALELLHPNSSQSTIRRAGSESPGGGGIVKSRVAMRSQLEGQQEEDEGDEGLDRPASLPNLDDHSLHLPVAGHSRTPSRTKRRSVSSTLTVERRLSHHSMSGNWQRYHPEDYLTRLNEERAPHFSTPSEKHLLNSLNDMGVDIGQMQHSVGCDACDSSAAMWWILRAKQAERGETDDVVLARAATAARKRERASAFAREERRKAREASAASASEGKPPEPRMPAVTFDEASSIRPVRAHSSSMDLGAPIGEAHRDLVTSPEALTTASDPISSQPPTGPPAPPQVTVPSTPPRAFVSAPSPEVSPVRDRERMKSRSPSMNMLQRATSAWVGMKKADDRTEAEHAIGDKDKVDTSPSKLVKPPPRAKLMPRSESDNTLLAAVSRQSTITSKSVSGTPSGSPLREKSMPLERSPLGQANGTVELGDSPAPSTTTPVTAEQLASGSSKPKGSKRDSLWNTFRHLFNEEKRRRKRNPPGSPLSAEVRVAPVVVLSRGANSRTPHTKRSTNAPGSRRTSMEGQRPTMYSRRSSSINSRRSSFDGGSHLYEQSDIVGALHRRTSGRSHGSQTPTSDREYVDFPSRPGSSHSAQKGSSRRSSMSVRSPPLPSDSTSARFKNGGPPASPLRHTHRRRPAGGTDPSRIRHIRVIPESQVLRSSSVASSTKSASSSRASSVDGRRDSGLEESGRDDASSIRSQKRRRKDRRSSSLAQQIYRTRSPLVGESGHADDAPPKVKAPIRDVFQKTKDDDWISEEEDEFASGLGQGGRSSGQMWMNGTRAAAFPDMNAQMRHSTLLGRRRERGRRTSLEEKEDAAKSKAEPKGLGIMDSTPGGRARRGIPPARSAAPVIEEEEEEEEEEG
ncbi:hypothetical protein IAU60_003590 [Kwoniella sp. DSM 27419]